MFLYSQDIVMLNGFGTVVNALGKRVKPYLPQICGTILWRLNNKSAKVRQQAADLISRIAQVMMTCGEVSIEENTVSITSHKWPLAISDHFINNHFAFQSNTVSKLSCKPLLLKFLKRPPGLLRPEIWHMLLFSVYSKHPTVRKPLPEHTQKFSF